MSKNMTRKGLALGTGIALVSSAFVGVMPANAAGTTGFMDLVPSSGPKDGFAVFSESGKTIQLVASSIATGGNLKLLVSDASGVFEPTRANNTFATAATIAADADIDAVQETGANANDGTATITAANSLSVGDLVSFSADVVEKVGSDKVFEADSIYEVTAATGAAFSIKGDVTHPMADAEVNKDETTVVLVRSARSAGSYVIDTGVTTAGNTTVTLALNSTSGDTYSATVQAFRDADGDGRPAAGAINEYVSPARVLTFVDPEDVVATTVLDAPTIGSQTLSASVTTDPVLNEAQNGETGEIKITYTRQDSTKIGVSGAASQNTTTGVWTATALPLNVVDGNANNNNADDVDFYTAADGTIAAGDGADWGLSRAIAGAAASTVVVDDVATTTQAGHLLRIGDKVTFAGGGDAALNGNQFTVTSVPSSSTFTFTVDRADTTAALTNTYTVTTLADNNKSLVDGVFAGTYSARAVILVDYDVDGDVANANNEWYYAGAADTRGTFAASATDVKVTTVGSATLQGAEYNTDAANKILVKAGANLTVPVVATLLDKEGAAIGAGRSVLVRLNSVSADVKVNGKVVNSTLYTDANGQVTFDVTSAAGADGAAADIDVQPEGDNTYTTRVIVEWDKQDYTMTDMAMTSAGIATPRVIAAGGTYDLKIRVMDEWFQPATAADYRVKVSGSGVSEGFVTLVDGVATVKVTDNKLSTTGFTSSVTLQKLGATGLWADVAGSKVDVVNNIAPTAATLALAANGQTLYKATKTVTTSAVAAVALVELDKRLELKQTPVYKNNAVVTGKAYNGSTAAPLAGSVVTISGPSSILFEEGQVAKRGSLTFMADGSGEFAVNLYSTTAQKDTVITVTANGVSKEVKVTFTGIGVGEGTALTVTAPEAVKPASTFQVKAKLADTYGNGVDTAAGRVKVTYTGPGIVFGTLPDQTDANGELMFSVLLGSNDTGNIVVTVSYDQNGDADYVDAKDLNTTKTIVISSSGSVTTGKVNVGSFNGKLVVYAANLNGARISWKVGGNWGSAVADSNYDIFNRPTPRAGVTVSVDIYVNGVKTLTKSVVTR